MKTATKKYQCYQCEGKGITSLQRLRARTILVVEEKCKDCSGTGIVNREKLTKQLLADELPARDNLEIIQLFEESQVD